LLRPRPVFFLAGWFMTYRADVAWGRDVVARWYALAEQRLAHLTELFETGRWRRYYSENVFLENVREAKAMLEIWRDLTAGKVPHEDSKNQILALRRTQLLPSLPILPAPFSSAPNEPGTTPQATPTSDLAVAPEANQVSLAQDSIAPDSIAPDSSAQDSSAQNSVAEDGSASAGGAQTIEADPGEAPLDLVAIEKRYPLLRNSL
jgi:uncharacterized repeat protein (TIGR03809 family)